MAHTELIHDGYAWVGVSAQKIGVEGGNVGGLNLGLKVVDRSRYGSLNHPGDSFSYDIFTQAVLPRRAAVAHVVYSPDVRRPVEIGADQEDRLVAWLSKRLGAPVKPPKLGGLGYELIGGRRLPSANGPVAQFMYHNVTGRRLTLYVSTELVENDDTAFRFPKVGPVNVFYWLDRNFGYALSAGIDKGELARVATEVHRQVST